MKNYCGLTVVISLIEKMYNDRKYYEFSNMELQSIIIKVP